MNGPMTRNRLARILEAYGGNPSRWPEAERAAALALLESLPDAQQLREQALRLDLLLDASPETEPSPELRTAVLSARPRRSAPRFRLLPWRDRIADLFGEIVPGLPARRMAATVLAASFLCGAALGAFGGNPDATAAANGEYWPGAYIASIYQSY
ncbi:hypothetical protein [Paucidesulfovibrio longus]|uniref:hypothetical protein n=1 Tax=Paucidesulfovibrio longus TaxID=889 RepID=UPI0003B536FE|nr:hypothetical protein [Paucidesulfovibrio longus]